MASKKDSWYDDQMQQLFSAVLLLRTKQECKKFMRDLCTLNELKVMSQRWQAVLSLKKGESYREISKKTGLSTATVTRIALWLHNGEGGYELILNRLK